MVNSSEFTKRLEKIMDFYGLSGTAFSEEIDFNRSTISHLLSGRNKPSLEFVMKVVQHFPEVELYWLLNGKGSFPAQKENATNNPSLANTSSESASAVGRKKNQDFTFTKTNSLASSEDPPADRAGKPTAKPIDRIVIFYTDGTFKEYHP